MPLSATGQYSTLLIDYLSGQDVLRPFYGSAPSLSGLEAQIEKKRAFPIEQRKHLQKILRQQSEGVARSPQQEANLSALSAPNTFLITTAHQLNICTGPLYLPFKIVTAIALARRLEVAFPETRFVPLFWMHSEDHDVNEIRRIYLNGQYYEAKLSGSRPVGQYSSAAVEALLRELPISLPEFLAAYTEQPKLVDASRHLLQKLFGKKGLLILDPTDASLKTSLLPLLSADLKGDISRSFLKKSSALEAAGYKRQLKARSLHFFYIENNRRSALRMDAARIKVEGSEKAFETSEDLIKEAQNQPERLSPSAALRPLYQELILPNIAYVGGPSEIAYWMQLGEVFAHQQLEMPVLFPRFFGALIPKKEARRLKKLNLNWSDLFHSDRKLHYQLLPELKSYDFIQQEQQMLNLFKEIETEVSSLDPGLRAYVEHQTKTATRPLQQIRNKIRKHLLRRSDQIRSSLTQAQSILRPEDRPQERILNLMPFLAEDPQLLDQLIEEIDPFDFRFHFAILEANE